MFNVEGRAIARLAATAGLGITLALGVAPKAALGEDVSSDAPPILPAAAEEYEALEAGNTDGVAKIGETIFKTLEEAFSAASSDGTLSEITLIADARIDSATIISKEKNIDLNLNGNEIIFNKRVILRGSLTVRDTSADESGRISGAGSLVSISGANAKLSLVSGTLATSGPNAVTVSAAGASFDVTGGIVEAKTNAVYLSVGSATITGGILNGDVKVDNVAPSTPSLRIGSDGNVSSPQINGRVVSGLSGATISLVSGVIEGVEGMLPENTVLGSVFMSDVSDSLHPSMNKGCSEKDGIWIVGDLTESNAGLKVTHSDGASTLYASLASFIEDGSHLSDGDVLVLQKDATGPIEFEASGSYVLDLNNHTLTSAEPQTVVVSAADAEVTIRNGSIVSTSPDESATLVLVASESGNDKVNVNLDEVNLEMKGSGGAAIQVYGINENNNVALTGCTLTVPDSVMGIYYPPVSGTLSIVDSAITAGTGVGIKGGTVRISGTSTINATGAKGNASATGSGIAETGDAIYIEASYGRDITLDIEDGTFVSSNGNAVKTYIANDYQHDAEVSIADGSFSAASGSDAIVVEVAEGGTQTAAKTSVSGGSFSSPVNKNYCAEGFKPVATPNASGDYVVAKAQDVVRVGENTYDSIAEALENASGNVELVLLADVYENVAISENVSVTIDLAGYTLTNVEGSHTVTVKKGASLTVRDSSDGGTGVIDNVTHAKGALVNYGTVVVEGGTLTRSKEASTGPSDNGENSWYVIDNQGTMTFNGGTVENEGYFSSLIRNLNGTLFITDGEFSNHFIAIKNDDGGKVEIKGGSIVSDDQAIQNWGTATISGGTLTGDVDTWSYVTDNPTSGFVAKTQIEDGAVINGDVYSISYEGGAKSSVSVTGGQINGAIGTANYNGGIVIDSTPQDSSDLAVSGGTFSESPRDYLDDSCVAKVEANSFTVMDRGDLPAGTYLTPEGAEELTPDEFQPGLSITVDPETGVVTATRPYTPPAQTGEQVKVEQPEGAEIEVSPSRADEGEKVTVTVTPDEGREVVSVTVTDADGGEVEVTPGEKDGEYTFEMPGGPVTVTAETRCDGGELCPSRGLADVLVGEWCHDAVDWAVETGLMTGYDHVDAFGVSDPLSRAQLAQVLWNRAGRPAADASAVGAFPDCSEGEFYAEAVAWCNEQGIMTGYEDGTFGPADPVTREQLATVLWRAAGSPEADADLSAFPDAADVSAFASGAMAWAVETGAISGQGSDGALDPVGDLERSQCAMVFYRLDG